MEPVFDTADEEPIRERRMRVIARFTLTALFFLFLRTLLWVLDGVFSSNPPELRLSSVGIFLLAGFALWRLLDLKSYARRLFVGLSVLTWSTALLALARTYHQPMAQFTPIQIAEYGAFIGWIVVSVLFVAYLMQPVVREMFTEAPTNGYGRLLFLVLLGHMMYFEWHQGIRLLETSIRIGVSNTPALLSLGRFQEECSREERAKLPPSVGEDQVANFCRCDSTVLADRCPAGLASREQCLHHIESRLKRNTKAKASFLDTRDSCVAQYLSKERPAIYQKARALLERNVLQRLSVAVPLEREVAGEAGQRKYLYCMTLALFSRCSDPKPAATYTCLSKPLEGKEVDSVRGRCLRLARVKQGSYEEAVAAAEKALAAGKISDAVPLADKAIALGSDRPEGYLVRGIANVQRGQHKSGADDLTIVLNVSDFTHTRIRALEGRRIAHENLKDAAAAEADAREACSLGAAGLCSVRADAEPFAWQTSEDVATVLSKAVTDEAVAGQLAWAPVHETVAQQETRTSTAEPEPKASPAAEAAPREVSAQVPAAAPTEPAAEAAIASIADKDRQAWNELMQVGDLAYKTGDAAQAKDKYRAALGMAEGFGSGNELWVLSSLRLAGYQRDKGEWADGEGYLRKTFPKWATLAESSQRAIVEEVGRYSTAYQAKHEWKLQERLLLEVWKEASASESLLVREINLYLSGLYGASGRGEKLDPFFRRETEIFEKRFGKKDPRTEASRVQLSNYYLSRGETDKAGATLASPVKVR